MKSKPASVSSIEKVKAETKLRLSEIPESEIYTTIQNQLTELSNDTTQDSLTTSVILLLSALYRHAQFGGLGKVVRNDYAEKAETISMLLTKPNSAARRLLLGDLSSIFTTILENDGERWGALGEAAFARKEKLSDASVSPGLADFAIGMSYFRFGSIAQACVRFEAARQAGLAPQNLRELEAAEAIALRLHRGTKAFAERYGQEGVNPRCDESLDVELAWQKLVTQCIRENHFWQLVRQTQTSQAFSCHDYPLDAFFWVNATRQVEWRDKFPTLDSLSRRGIQYRDHGEYWLAASRLEFAYSSKTLSQLQIRKLMSSLDALSHIRSFEQELLIVASFCRLFARKKLFSIAAPLYEKYGIMSHRCTSGRTNDALEILGDLENKSWLETV